MFGITLHNYCLIHNHYHLLVEITKELTVNTENFMNMLSSNPTRVANYFQYEKIAYAG